MDFSEAKEQIADLLSSTCDHSEWNDIIEEHFPGEYGVKSIDVETNYKDIWVEWDTKTFTFKDAILSFNMLQYSDSELELSEHGECLASGNGKFTYSFRQIVSIEDIEINLYPQKIISPQYNAYDKCWNIANVLSSLRKAYPYPDTGKLAEWADVSKATIKKWENEPQARATGSKVRQLMDSFSMIENIAYSL